MEFFSLKAVPFPKNQISRIPKGMTSISIRMRNLLLPPGFFDRTCRKHDPCYCLFLEEIGLKNGAALHEIFRQAKKIGCRPCPENRGLFLRLTWKSQPQSRSSVLSGTHRSPEQSVVVLSEEMERDDAFPKGLYLRNADGILWLHGYAYDPAYRFSGADLFAFEKVSSLSSN